MATLLTRQLPPGEAGLAASPGRHAALLVQRQAAMAAYVGDFPVDDLAGALRAAFAVPAAAPPGAIRMDKSELPNRHAVHGGPLGARP